MATQYSTLFSSDATAIDCSNANLFVLQIKVEATCTDDAHLYFLFKTDTEWQKYDAATASWVDVAGELTGENVAKNGNTLEEVQNWDSSVLSKFIGKKVNFAVAAELGSTDSHAELQKLEIFDDTFSYGDEVKLGDEPVEIREISIDKAEVGKGAVRVYASLQGADGTWGAYQPCDEKLVGQKAKGIRFRASMTVETPGTDAATLSSVSVSYKGGNISVDGTSSCITKVYTLPEDVSSAHLLLRHSTHADAAVKAYISFKNADNDPEVWTPMEQDTVSPDSKDASYVKDQFDYDAGSNGAHGKIVTLKVDLTTASGSEKEVFLGVGTGSPVEFQLPHMAKKNSISISPETATWTYDEKTQKISITADAGQRIEISYDWGAEESVCLDSMFCMFN